MDEFKIAPPPINPSDLPGPLPSIGIPDVLLRPLFRSMRSPMAIHIGELLEETLLTQEEFSKEMGCDASTISRHIAGTMKPRKKTLREYDATFSKLLKRQVVVNRNATKRK
jgi:hypothetical protein